LNISQYFNIETLFIVMF